MCDNIKRRNRLGECNRWSKEDKNLLLSLIGQNPPRFEKPTARIYYGKMTESHPYVFNSYGWKGMRDKMRNLRLNYMKATEFINQNGSVLNCEDPNGAARQQILKLCEDYDVLNEIFGKSKLNQSGSNDETSEYMDGECGDPGDYMRMEMGSGEWTLTTPPLATSPQPSNASGTDPAAKKLRPPNCSIDYLTEVQKEKTEYLREKLRHDKDCEAKKISLEKEKFVFLKSSEERKLEIEEKRIALDSKKLEEETRLKEIEIENNFTLSKMKLEKDMYIKELEIKCKYNKM